MFKCLSHYFFLSQSTPSNYQFLFLAVNQQTVANMDNFSLLQIIERISELMFKYMGSYLSDAIPQLTKYYFAIISSAPSKDRGEHWNMSPRLDKS